MHATVRRNPGTHILVCYSKSLTIAWSSAETGAAASGRTSEGPTPDHVHYPDPVAQATWWRYVVTVTGNATQKDIAAATGIDQSSISRWQSGTNTPRAEAVVTFARTYRRSPVEALIAADYLSSEDVGVVEMTTLTGDLTRVSIDSLLSEIRRRVLAADAETGSHWPAGWSADDPAMGRRENVE